MEKYSVTEVFTPTSPARLTFVERETINDKLVDALKTPGKQLVVYGHSGSGKTTLLVNKLHQIYSNHITTRCLSGLTLDQLLLNAFDELGSFYDAEKTHMKKKGFSVSVKGEYGVLKSSISAQSSEASETKTQRVLPPQLTPQRLAKFMGEAGCCWVLEDFHKIDEQEKTKLAQMLKIFMDMADDYRTLKVIAIGAVGTAREVVQYEHEMKRRVAEIEVPLMTNKEIGQILSKGEKLLNISMPLLMKEKVVNYSNGLAAVCHQLALNMCFTADIVETLPFRRVFGDGTFDSAVKRYIEEESDTMKESFDRALRQKKARKYDNGRLILQALTAFDFERGATHSQLLGKIRRVEPKYPASNLTVYLKDLHDVERGGLISSDIVAGKYIFSSPFYYAYALMLFNLEPTGDKKVVKSVRKSLDELFRDSGALITHLSKVMEGIRLSK